MAGTGSYERGDSPRSVPDPLDAKMRRMEAQQRAYNDRQARDRDRSRNGVPATLSGGPIRGIDPPERRFEYPRGNRGDIPFVGPFEHSLASFEDARVLEGLFNAGLAASDLALIKSLMSGLGKGGLKLAGPHKWRSKPWEREKGMRQWMTDQGFAEKGQPVHHWVRGLEQRSKVPDFIKNQPLFTMPMKDAVQHGRLHGPYTVGGVRMPRYNPVERFIYGTPDWFKATAISAPGHAATPAPPARTR